MSMSHVGGVLLDQDMGMRDYLRLQFLKRNQSHPAHPSVYTKHHPEARFFWGGRGRNHIFRTVEWGCFMGVFG